MRIKCLVKRAGSREQGAGSKQGAEKGEGKRGEQEVLMRQEQEPPGRIRRCVGRV